MNRGRGTFTPPPISWHHVRTNMLTGTHSHSLAHIRIDACIQEIDKEISMYVCICTYVRV